LTHRSKAATQWGAEKNSTRNFLNDVERITDAYVGGEDTAVEDVRRILLQVRQQYDSVHHEAEKKEAQLKRIREEIRCADQSHWVRGDETHRLEDSLTELDQKYEETVERIHETQTCRKVYEHMLKRIQKEQAILKQKMLKMEEHMVRKRREVHQKIVERERTHTEKVQKALEYDLLERDADSEREACKSARDVMEGELERRKDANKRRADFESWRREVALEAANEAFNASAGRLRKLYAIEKLAGNCLQKITYEQVERSQTTENGFQKIRDVTGLADVMDIVHKFLNRDVEHEQLKGSVKDAEVRLEALRQDFDAFKRDTEGITFDPAAIGRSGDIYKDFEESERVLNDAMKEHEMCRVRLQKTTLQVEHLKRWTARVGQLLVAFEDPVDVKGPKDLPAFFSRLEVAVEKFVKFVDQQLRDVKITRKGLSQVQTREYNEQAKLLASEQFLRANCRVPATADGRPVSRQGGADDDPDALFAADREKCKADSGDLARTVQAEQQKKRPKGVP